MAPLEPEWMLWAKKFQDEHKALLLRIDDLAQATTKIGPLVERTKDLDTRTEHLQQGNNLLTNKFSLLEGNTSKREDTVATEIERLRERIGELEQTLDRTIGSLEERRENNKISCAGKERSVMAQRPLNLRSRAGEVIISIISLILVPNGFISLQSNFADHNYRRDA